MLCIDTVDRLTRVRITSYNVCYTKLLRDGPLAFDNAVSAVSARYKKIKSDVAGDCDLLLVPDIEVGNVLYKALVFFAKAKVASTILGAQAPIVLTS